MRRFHFFFQGEFDPKDADFKHLVQCATLCNNAKFMEGEAKVTGDASETALLKFVNKQDLEGSGTVEEVSFDLHSYLETMDTVYKTMVSLKEKQLYFYIIYSYRLKSRSCVKHMFDEVCEQART